MSKPQWLITSRLHPTTTPSLDHDLERHMRLASAVSRTYTGSLGARSSILPLVGSAGIRGKSTLLSLLLSLRKPGMYGSLVDS